MRIPVLIALREGVEPDIYKLEANLCVIGRSDTCQIVIPDKAISRIHSTIERNGPYCYLHDANSANGTYVNGQRIREKYLLKDQDQIGFGPGAPLLRFEDTETTAQVLPQLSYDAQKMEFFLNNKPFQLTPNELKLLHYLYQHIGDLCLREQCAHAVWKRYDPDTDDEGLHTLVTRIRKKLREINPDARDIIVARQGIGYMLNL